VSDTFPRHLSGIFEYEQNVNAITTDDIKNVANKLLSGDNVITAILYPQKK
jgi:predicted Zn-dependent peptidase